LKKIASVILLGLLLFNCCGYRWVLNALQQQADARLEAKLDKHEYDDSQLVDITVPVNMPYQTNWADFERYDGEIELNGVHYKYVKRKVENGQLILKCIPNHAKQQLETAKGDLFKISNDLQQGDGAKKPGSPLTSPVKNILSDFDNLQQLQVQTSYATLSTRVYNIYQQAATPLLHHAIPGQPPEA